MHQAQLSSILRYFQLSFFFSINYTLNLSVLPSIRAGPVYKRVKQSLETPKKLKKKKKLTAKRGSKFKEKKKKNQRPQFKGILE
jgi:hypothetical protein